MPELGRVCKLQEVATQDPKTAHLRSKMARDLAILQLFRPQLGRRTSLHTDPSIPYRPAAVIPGTILPSRMREGLGQPRAHPQLGRQ